MERHFLDMLFLIENDSNGSYKFSFDDLLDFHMDMDKKNELSTFHHALEYEPISIHAVHSRLHGYLSKLKYQEAMMPGDDSGYYVSSDDFEEIEYHSLIFLFNLFPGCTFQTPLKINGTTIQLTKKQYNHDAFNYFHDPLLHETHPSNTIFRESLFLILRGCIGNEQVQSMVLQWKDEWPPIFCSFFQKCINNTKQYSSIPKHISCTTQHDFYFLQSDIFRSIVYWNSMRLDGETDANTALGDKMKQILTGWEALAYHGHLIKHYVATAEQKKQSAL